MKKVMIKLLPLLFMVIVALLIFQKSLHKPHTYQTLSETKSPVKKTVDSPQNIQKAAKKTILNVPGPFHSIKGVMQQTAYLGTADHPTINGGIINAPGVVVSRDLSESITTEKKSSNEPRVLLASSNVEKKSTNNSNSEFFQDNWATSERVGRLLRKAAQEGKLSYVLKKTDEMGLPANLAIVPMVESNYQNNAVSIKGAAGVWQLMPSTAKDYGLNKQDRFQFTVATDAALKLLNDLHQQFGNWVLAFAAYNAGSQRVKLALAKNPRSQTIEELDLPLETKAYVKKIMDLNKTMISMEANHG
jgi:Transglycosylase SLT domain